MMMIARTAGPASDRITVRTVLVRYDATLTDAPVDAPTVARQSSSRNPTWIVTW
jgi:hypothetical protein